MVMKAPLLCQELSEAPCPLLISRASSPLLSKSASIKSSLRWDRLSRTTTIIPPLTDKRAERTGH